MRCPELSIAIACSLPGNFSTISASFQSNLHRQLLVNWFPLPLYTPLFRSLFDAPFLTFSRPSPGAFLWFLLEEKSVSNLACQKPCWTKERKKERAKESEGEGEELASLCTLHIAHCQTSRSRAAFRNLDGYFLIWNSRHCWGKRERERESEKAGQRKCTKWANFFGIFHCIAFFPFFSYRTFCFALLKKVCFDCFSFYTAPLHNKRINEIARATSTLAYVINNCWSTLKCFIWKTEKQKHDFNLISFVSIPLAALTAQNLPYWRKTAAMGMINHAWDMAN